MIFMRNDDKIKYMDKLENNINYLKALEFIKQNDLKSLPIGKHVINDGELWVNIVEAKLRPASEALLEVHDEYIDIHVPISGPEIYGVKKRTDCRSPKGEIDRNDDILFFDDPVEETFTAEAGTITVFEPDMAHAPLIGEGEIYKAIFKVKVK